MSRLEKIIAHWNASGTPVEERLREALAKLEKLQAERMKLDRRIHNQRCSNRITWEIVEMRRKWLGSDAARRAYGRLLKRYRELLKKSCENRV